MAQLNRSISFLSIFAYSKSYIWILHSLQNHGCPLSFSSSLNIFTYVLKIYMNTLRLPALSMHSPLGWSCLLLSFSIQFLSWSSSLTLPKNPNSLHYISSLLNLCAFCGDISSIYSSQYTNLLSAAFPIVNSHYPTNVTQGDCHGRRVFTPPCSYTPILFVQSLCLYEVK